MKVFITGIDGFLGAKLHDYLVRKRHKVTGNDSLICNTGLTQLATWNVDCRDFEHMSNMFDLHETEVLVHCAATAHEGLSSFSPSFVTKNIFEASVATFSAAIAAGVKRIVFMSSMARYGRGQFGPPFSETMTPAPVDPYGIAKVAAEQVLRVLCETHGIKWCCLVPHNIIGPGQKYDDPYRNVVAIMINRVLQGLPIQIYGDGEQVRCFSPVTDILPCIEAAIEGNGDGEIINIGPDCGEISINLLANFIWDESVEAGPTLVENLPARPKTLIENLPARPNEVRDAYCVADKSRRLLGYKPHTTFIECLSDMIDYILDHGVKPFQYFAPIEIERGLPETWKAARFSTGELFDAHNPSPYLEA